VRRRIALELVLAWTFVWCCAPLHGAAWTQEEGHGQIIVNFSYLDTSRWFDPSGKLQTFGSRGSFRQFDINPYLECGLTPRTTLTLSTFAPFMKFANDYGASSSGGLGDTEIGVRRRLTAESGTVVSVQFSVQFPLYPADRTPPPGNHQADLESRLIVGRGGSLAGRHVFAGAGAAYRYRNGAPADQFRSDATAGMDFSRRFTGMVQFFGITGIRNGAPFPTGGNPNVQSDFDLYKAQFSFVTRLQARTRFQIGWVDAFKGRNTGAGGALVAAIWRDF